MSYKHTLPTLSVYLKSYETLSEKLKMKTIIFILFILIGTVSKAQVEHKCFTFRTSKCGPHEIGLNLFSIQNAYRNKIHNTFSAQFSYPSGLLYKLHCGKDAFRAGFDYFDRKIDTEDFSEMRYIRNTGNDLTKELRLGYERKFGKSKFQPIIGADLVLAFNRKKGIVSGYGDFSWWYTETSYDRSTKIIAVAPFIGVKYFLNRRLSVSTELNFAISYFYEDKYHQEAQALFNPVRSLSINYHFK